MNQYRASYRKTVLLAGAALVATLALLPLLGNLMAGRPGALLWFAEIAALVVSIPLLLIVMGGWVVLRRDARLAEGKRDYFLAASDSRSETSVGRGGVDFGIRFRRLMRAVFAPQRLIVGDRVKVRSLADIRATLDPSGCVDGLPFMPEMARFCGGVGTVFRRVDKVYDYGGKKNLRRMRNAVLLQGMRCDGDAHGGCQAACYVLWKEEWLQPANQPARTLEANSDELALKQIQSTVGSADRYACQFTSFVSASTPLSQRDPRGDLRPLFSGNVTLAGWLAVMLTRWFNFVQALRGGVLFPSMPSVKKAEQRTVAPLMPGTTVIVQAPASIAETLDKNSKNRGLWFDRDMLKHCGHRYTVSRRVDRIIDDVTGQMRTMKTPCIVLDGVNYSGEGLRFCAQEENLYWREAWLSPEDRTSEPKASESMKAAG